MTPNGRHTPLTKGRIDWWTIGIWLAIAVLGWINLYAAIHDEAQIRTFDLTQKYGRQLLWIAGSMVAAFFIMLIDDKYYHILAYPIYIAALLMLLSTLVFGRVVNGAKAWLVFGSVAIQPTEFVKFATSLALARYMSNFTFSINRFGNLLRMSLLIALPVAVMFLQNDKGSAVVYASFLFMLYREGLNRWVYIIAGMVLVLFFGSFWVTDTGLLILLLTGCSAGFAVRYRNVRAPLVFLASVLMVSMIAYFGLQFIAHVDFPYYYTLLITSLAALPIAWMLAYTKRIRRFGIFVALFVSSLAFVSVTDLVFDRLDLHQQKRILDTLGIESDLRGWGYNVNQSKIAIGSGGFLGKGYLEGTQTKFNFVPEQSTDFIFCTVGEEWGFVGAAVVLGLFCALIMRIVRMGERQREPFGRIYCYCVAGILFFHVLINIGMTIGLVPVIGIPLPFFSYGGSSFLAFTILLFVALRIDYGAGEFDPSNL